MKMRMRSSERCARFAVVDGDCDVLRKRSRRSDEEAAEASRTLPRRTAVARSSSTARSTAPRDGSRGEARRQLAAAASRSDDRAGRAGEAPLRRREVGDAAHRALPRLQGRDRRRRGQQAARAVSPRDRALPPQVLSGARTRSSARSPTSRTTSSSTRRSSGSRSSRPTCRSPPTSSSASASTTTSRSPSSTTRTSASSTGSSTTCSAATSTATASTRTRSASSRRSIAESKYYVQAQFFSGISNVQLRQSSPGGAVVPAHRRRDRRGRRRGRRGRGAHARPRVPLDGAHVLLGVGSPRRERTRRPSTARKLSAAVKYWNKVDVASEYWLDALFEESWAYFMAGDYAHALGNIHTIESPYFPNSYYPEADVLKAVIYFANCQYDDARDDRREVPGEVPADLRRPRQGPRAVQGRRPGRAFYKFLKDVRDDKAHLHAAHQAVVENALSRSPAPPQPRVRAAARRREKRFGKAPAASRTRSSATTSRTRAARARPRRPQRRPARARALPAQPRRAQRAPPQRREDPHRHHGREAQPARPGDRRLAGHGRRSRSATS